MVRMSNGGCRTRKCRHCGASSHLQTPEVVPLVRVFGRDGKPSDLLNLLDPRNPYATYGPASFREMINVSGMQNHPRLSKYVWFLIVLTKLIINDSWERTANLLRVYGVCDYSDSALRKGAKKYLHAWCEHHRLLRHDERWVYEAERMHRPMWKHVTLQADSVPLYCCGRDTRYDHHKARPLISVTILFNWGGIPIDMICSWPDGSAHLAGGDGIKLASLFKQRDFRHFKWERILVDFAYSGRWHTLTMWQARYGSETGMRDRAAIKKAFILKDKSLANKHLYNYKRKSCGLAEAQKMYNLWHRLVRSESECFNSRLSANWDFWKGNDNGVEFNIFAAEFSISVQKFVMYGMADVPPKYKGNAPFWHHPEEECTCRFDKAKADTKGRATTMGDLVDKGLVASDYRKMKRNSEKKKK